MAFRRSSQLSRMVAQKTIVVVLISLLSSSALPRAAGVDLSSPHATFYGGSDVSGTNNGACGYGNTFSFGYGTMTTALSSALFDNGYMCGACFQITCVGDPNCYSNSIVVTATNLCPQGSYSGVCDYPQQHFDLSQPAFAQIAPSGVGLVNVQYQRVSCQKTGGIMFNIQGHTYFLQVLVYNVGGMGDVSSLQIAGSTTGWTSMSWGWGTNYNTGTVFDGQPLSFMVSNAEGSTVTSWNVADAYWQYGMTYEGQQF
jgi:hypothetical protein